MNATLEVDTSIAHRLPPPPATETGAGLVDIARVLVLLQGAFLSMTTLEVLLWALFGVPSVGPSLLVTGAFALGILLLAAGLGRRVRVARRAAIVVEALVLLWAAVDLALAVLMAHRWLGLVATITRIGMPVAVIVLLRRPSSRLAFRSTSPEGGAR